MRLRKYFQVFKSNWQVDFEYRLNFFLGRIQNILVLFTLYFLWSSVFADQQEIFGYSGELILTYVVLSHLVRNLVFNSQAKFVGEEIKSGHLSSVLLKPINYLWQSFSQDVARRMLNVLTSIIEVGIFIVIVRPSLFIQSSVVLLLMFALSIVGAIVLHYVISFTAALVSFWSEEHFGPSFLMEVIMAMLSGALYPLDALPALVTNVLKVLPFYYVVFFPINIYLGRVDFAGIAGGFVVMGGWLLIFWFVHGFVWREGLKVYQAYGG